MKFEEIMAYREEVGFTRGEKAGVARGELVARRQTIVDVLEMYGEITDELRNKIEQMEDPEILSQWIKLAVKAGSVEEFEKML